jgi:DNA-binding beta-propeller fold protein YncE
VGAVRGARRIVTVAAVAMAVGLLPAVAHAQVFGSLAQLASPNNCIESTSSGSSDCTTTAPGLDDGTDDVAVSPDGQNVYVMSTDDESIAEFTRNADGSLAELGCIASSSDSGSTCSNQTAIGLDDPQAIAISPNGQNVYVAVADDGSGDVAEFTRNADGSLTPVANNGCIAEHGSGECPTNDNDANGLESPVALAVSPDGDNVYVGDSDAEAVTTLTRNPTDGSLSQPDGAADCIQDTAETDDESDECSNSADGLSEVTGVAVSPDGGNVYTTGSPNEDENGSIAEFSRGAGGALTPIGCLGTPEDDDPACGGGTATGLVGISGLVVSADGENVYTASEEEGGPISEFSRGAGGALQQLQPPNDCIADTNEEGDFGCGTTTGVGIADGYQLAISPDGANIYVAAPVDPCFSDDGCADVAEFARNLNDQGALTQLASPDSCIQDTTLDENTGECPNESGTGLGGAGVAVSPDNASVYVTGEEGVAEFARAIPTLTVSLAGPGSGGVSDGTGGISCQPTCSHAYGIGQVVTLTATPAFGSAFSGWSGGGCSGTGTCQVVMDADTAVTATFAVASGAPGVSPGPPTVTGPNGAGLSGSVDPEGLTTTAYFEYGIDLSDRGPGSSTTLYDQTTPVQPVGADFSEHAISSTLAGLVPNVTYHFRLVANNGAGTATGPDQTFTTAKNAPPPTPVLGKTVNVSVVSGQVFILPPPGQSLGGAGDRAALSKGASFEPLTEARQIPTGSEIDALHGSLKMVSNTGKVGKTQTATLTGSVFKVTQVRKGITKGMTDFNLIESAFQGAPSYGLCKAKGKKATDATVASLSTKTLQLLKVSGHGKFRTTGRYSAATVRGTIYTVADKCNGTLTHVIRDTVLVDDFARHKTILLHAGQSYLAKKP